jgi:hypothetical protein
MPSPSQPSRPETPVCPDALRRVGRRIFNGLPILDPSNQQQQRYSDILRYITPALNISLKKRPRLSLRPRPRRIDAVRLVVSGDTQEAARPYIVFFCTEDVGKVIKELLDQPSYQEILKVDGQTDVSFLYEIIHGGIRLTFYESRYSAEAPSESAETLTNCGTPLRLYPKDSQMWRRATLGGVLEATSLTGAITYYAMTAGHFLDDWDSTSDEHEPETAPEEHGSDALSQTFKSSPRNALESNEDLHSTTPPITHTSPWEFKRSKRYASLITPWTSGNSTTETFKYFDWAVFPLGHNEWSPNSFLRSGATQPAFICDHQRNSTSAGRRVAIITASRGTLRGVVLAGTANLAIEPGEAVIDVYIVSLQPHGELSNPFPLAHFC